MVLTVSFVLSPAIGLFCHRRGVRTTRLHRPQAAPSSCMPLTAHGEQSALRSHRTPNTAASTAPLPASVTIMIRPSGGVGCESSRCDLGQREQIFFGKSERKDSTPNGPTGKSLDSGESTFLVFRL